MSDALIRHQVVALTMQPDPMRIVDARFKFVYGTAHVVLATPPLMVYGESLEGTP
jgi:hypothetical protein